MYSIFIFIYAFQNRNLDPNNKYRIRQKVPDLFGICWECLNILFCAWRGIGGGGCLSSKNSMYTLSVGQCAVKLAENRRVAHFSELCPTLTEELHGHSKKM